MLRLGLTKFDLNSFQPIWQHSTIQKFEVSKISFKEVITYSDSLQKLQYDL